jgi:hypothetical protein
MQPALEGEYSYAHLTELLEEERAKNKHMMAENTALKAHVERLCKAIVDVNSLPVERGDEGGLMLTKAVLYTPRQSLLLHDAEVLEKEAATWTATGFSAQAAKACLLSSANALRKQAGEMS